MNKTTEMKKILKEMDLDFFILPNSDEFGSEYLPEYAKRLEFITGFSGSNAFVIIAANKNKKSAFFTDGRYTIQAADQVDDRVFDIFNLSKKSPLDWLLENADKNSQIGFDPTLHSTNFILNYQKYFGENLIALEKNPVDAIWASQPKAPDSKIFKHLIKYSGLSAKEKLKKIIANLDQKADAIILTNPASICWLFNIRASDIEYSPLLLKYAIIYKDGRSAILDSGKKSCPTSLQTVANLPQEILRLAPNSNVGPLQICQINFLGKNMPGILFLEGAVYTDIHEEPKNKITKQIEAKGKICDSPNVQIDFSQANYQIYSLLKSQNINIINQADPCLIPKAIKNPVEIKNAVLAHKIDGLAVTKFLFWLENSLRKKQKIDELTATKKLLDFRRQNKKFLYESFATIAGFGANGAIVHYHSTAKTNKTLQGSGLFLVDSGGQYLEGTTDITRTVAVGEPTQEMIENFTRVLKGHIAIARAKIPQQTTGNSLDILARYHLWQAGLDYDHGTGHGVGSFSSVHESPPSISKRGGGSALQAGMILSNEPGYYKAGEYGIRIENLMVVCQSKEKEGFLNFQTLSLAPIDPKLINFKMLTRPEKMWLWQYHLQIYEELKAGLSEAEKNWLKKLIATIKIKPDPSLEI